MSKAIFYQTVSQTVEVELGGRDLASLFWDLDAAEQAHFFNLLGNEPKLDFQLRAIRDCEEIKARGMIAMRSIGDYGEES